MEQFISQLARQSVAAGWVILALVLLRPLLKKLPRACACLLWALAAVRLLGAQRGEKPGEPDAPAGGRPRCIHSHYAHSYDCRPFGPGRGAGGGPGGPVGRPGDFQPAALALAGGSGGDGAVRPV